MMDHRDRRGRETCGTVGINLGVVKVSGTSVLVVEIFWRQTGWMCSVRDRE